MDAAHIHLILNHLPLAGMLFSIPLLLTAWWKRSEDLQQAGVITVLLTALITIPTFLSGEPAEEIIEHLPGVSEQLIKAHEEAAEIGVWIVGAAALAALICMVGILKKRTLPRWAIPVVTLLSVCSFGFLGWIANLGGMIRHPEIRQDRGAVSSTQIPGAEFTKEDKD